MATDVYINALDLDKASEIKNGDYIYIETPNGTELIDFENFILPKDNTLISETVSQNTDAIVSLSSEMVSNFDILSTAIEESTQPYIGLAQITIPVGSNQNSGVLSPTPTKTLNLKDVIITPANAYASKFNAYATDINSNGLISIKGSFNKNLVVLKNTNNVSLSSYLTTQKLSAYTASDFTGSLTVDANSLSAYFGNLSLSAIEIAAEEVAIYNIMVIKSN